MTLGIEVNQLGQRYGSFSALHNISFKLEGGKIYGLLGRNGSGKTSLLSIIASYRQQSDGEITIDGEAPFENARIMEQVCFIQESGHMPDTLYVRDVLKLSASCWPNWDANYADRLIRHYELPIKKRISTLSRGMKSALGVTIGLASRARLRFLMRLILAWMLRPAIPFMKSCLMIIWKRLVLSFYLRI